MKNAPPSIRKSAFNCPHCQAYAHQHWYLLGAKKCPEEVPFLEIDQDHEARRSLAVGSPDGMDYSQAMAQFREKMVRQPITLHPQDADIFAAVVVHVFVAECDRCRAITIWIHDRLLYPASGGAPPASPDLPAEIRPYYDEANSILDQSPRGAAALLRLCVQMLCKHLGESGKDINKDVAALVKKKKVDPVVQQAIDAVRITGNNSAHPGEMNMDDNPETAALLFSLVNFVVEKTISEPTEVKKFFQSLPAGALKAINKRDADSK